MCTYVTENLNIEGSGKGPAGWFGLTEASVYFDHPQHAPAGHTLNIDFLNPGQGPSARVAVELTATSARALAAAIESILAAAPPGLE
ncbi:MAG TPA: DUF6295 family protein [Streptosporangiaceae bacterium]|nr:DUF6295 family protein [Streptosporangiaceae bacterium]